MYNKKQRNAIYASKVGIEFEFYSNYKVEKTKDELTKLLNKRIRIEDKAHSDFQPTGEIFKIEPDMSGGKKMLELVTGSLPFVETKLIIAKVLKWIKENGSTDKKCSIHINISFDKDKIGPTANMMNLDIGKFVLNFDEDLVYKNFPNRKDSVYAKSIKYIFPLGGMVKMSDASALWKNYKTVSEKYYGINFSKLAKNYLEFRYLGGEDYHLKYDTIVSMMEYFIVSLYDVLENPTYTQDDFRKLSVIVKKHKKMLDSYKSFKEFKKNYPNIKILVDLKTEDQRLQMYYPKMRDKVFELLSLGGMTSGLINYDSDSGRIQIKDVELLKCFEVTYCDIFDSTIQGNVFNCDVFNSELKNCDIRESNIFGMSKIISSKIKDSYVNKNVICEDCYVFGLNGVFSATMKGGVFREGKVTKFANLKTAEVIEKEKI